MKRVLVTGASGFTGSYLCKALVEKGYQVKALVRRNSKRDALNNLNIDFIEGDLSDPDSFKNKIKK